MSKQPVKWLSPVPKNCDLCGTLIKTVFVDGKTRMGPWGCLCPLCHLHQGYGFGVGRGQRYIKQVDGSWLKVGG